MRFFMVFLLAITQTPLALGGQSSGGGPVGKTEAQEFVLPKAEFDGFREMLTRRDPMQGLKKYELEESTSEAGEKLMIMKSSAGEVMILREAAEIQTPAAE